MSQFLSNSSDYNSNSISDIDFTSAIRLPQEGSVCEVYKTRWQRRTVLVKRLKEEFRDRPLHLDALEKEYEIGVTLNHPSLPTYLAFDKDFIIMEYVDGDTLASMLRDEDPWLQNKKNQFSLLKRLVEVTDYLHRHKVVHCDIKPDNIILTANGYNPVLIDLDKCYTDAFNDTSGHPNKFGLPASSPGRMAMDFRGLANIAEAITTKHPTSASKQIRKFIDLARQMEVTTDILRESLGDTRTTGFPTPYFLAMGMILLATLIVGAFFFFKDREKGLDMESSALTLPQTLLDTITPSPSRSASLLASPPVREETDLVSEPGAGVRTQEQLHQDARAKAAVLDQLIASQYDALNARLDRLILLKTSAITGEQLLDSIRAYADFEKECFQEIGVIMKETFPPMSGREENRVLSYSKVYADYTRRSKPELDEIGRIIRAKMNR